MSGKIKTAIVLIDVQGKLAEIMFKSVGLLNNLEKLIKGANLLEIPIIWTEQLPNKLGNTTPRISKLLEAQNPIIKSEFSCHKNATFFEFITRKKFNRFLLCGIETHICVYQTAKDLLKEGHKVEIIGDATSSRTEQNKQIGIAQMTSLGAKLTSVEMLLFEKQKIALGSKFKDLIEIIK